MGQQKLSAVGRRLEQLRNDQNLSQSEFALKIGVKRQAYRHWLTGRNLPSGLPLMEIAKFTGCSADWLLGFRVPRARREREKIGHLVQELDSYIRGIDLGPDAGTLGEALSHLSAQDVFDSIVEQYSMRARFRYVEAWRERLARLRQEVLKASGPRVTPWLPDACREAMVTRHHELVLHGSRLSDEHTQAPWRIFSKPAQLSADHYDTAGKRIHVPLRFPEPVPGGLGYAARCGDRDIAISLDPENYEPRTRLAGQFLEEA